MRKKVIVLGCAGSIGTSTIDIIRHFPDLFELAGVSVHRNIQYLELLKKEFDLKSWAITFKDTEEEGREQLRKMLESTEADIVVNGISGAAGLFASVEAIKTHRKLALANKESIVMAGALLQKLAEKEKTKIIPVDSEHSALYQLIQAHGKQIVDHLIITASGGPFRTRTKEELKNITLEDALKHPTWNMGTKITIDSASLANKALEVIEAVNLFSMPADRITVTVHPESIVHSLIQTISGEIYAQLSPPNMRNPIFNALSDPQAAPQYLQPLDFTKTFALHFEPPRLKDFPMLELGFEAAKKMAAYPIAFNAANEEAVAAFIKGAISFIDISYITEKVLSDDWSAIPADFQTVMQADAKARSRAQKILQNIQR
ncbi:1-deoxy-D-xylulose-5-phosphate reductoisomerase [Treponema phagedenis]|uniref:1-deoxy-D-xylulose-5-phosphate reductoisomerase n=1 Tax=Treponema phagedenis TaxID=162 RepID=UPI0001F63A06|nr:1-deoxy-D-xylulose-5-phosphate reductoisomerase [Treponema phagedenis]EFW39229.1 1-deoxy-D-xylulose 5-phosphate reductoisomerase [Treponema phagedenis F0421]TYT78123.1 1-deoxy-D-xylulose-5-phosphate reductoisomerase [Treponema phagedenis]